MDSETPEKISIDLLDEPSESHVSLKERYQVLAKREALFKATLENMSDAVVITDDEGRFTFVCPNTATIFGLSTEEVLLLGSIERLLQAPVCKIDLLKAEREISNIEHRFVDIFGKMHFLIITAKSVDIGGGTAMYVMRDISNIKEVEKQNQSTERKFQHFISNFPGIAYQFRKNRKGEFSYDFISEKCLFFFGTPAAEIVKDSSLVFKCIPELDLMNVQRAIADSAKALSPYLIEHRVIRPDGRMFWIKVSSTPRNTGNGNIIWDGICLDITDRKQIEDSMHLTAETLRKAQRVGKITSWLYTSDGTSGDWRQKPFLFFRQDGQPAYGTYTDFASTVHPDDRRKMSVAMELALDKGIPFDLQLRVVEPNGEIGYVHSVCDVIKDESSHVIELIGTTQDVTAFHTVQKELLNSEARYRTVVEDQTELISRFTSDGMLHFVNKAYCQFFKKNYKELIGKKWHPVAFEKDLETIKTKLSVLSPTRPVIVIVNRVYKGDGSIRWVQFINRGIFNSSDKLVEIQSVGRDISDLKDIQIALQQKENELSEKNRKLEKLNIALEVVIEQNNEQLENLRSEIINQYNRFVKPYLEEFKSISHNQQDAQYLLLIEQGIQHIFSPFARQIMSPNYHFSPMETKVASLITSGATIKDIARGLNISPHTVKYHRKSIRSKLGIKNQKVNLCSYLTGESFGLKE
jgi:PAS domain S-box-containing protein